MSNGNGVIRHKKARFGTMTPNATLVRSASGWGDRGGADREGQESGYQRETGGEPNQRQAGITISDATMSPNGPLLVVTLARAEHEYQEQPERNRERHRPPTATMVRISSSVSAAATAVTKATTITRADSVLRGLPRRSAASHQPSSEPKKTSSGGGGSATT